MVDDNYQHSKTDGTRLDSTSPGWKNLISPLQVLKTAVREVPSLRYALGVAGLFATVAIILSFGIDVRLALLGVIVVLVLMVTLVVFAKLAASGREKRGQEAKQLRLAAFVLLWSLLSISILSAFLAGSSTFFAWPLDLSVIFGDRIVTVTLYNPEGAILDCRFDIIAYPKGGGTVTQTGMNGRADLRVSSSVRAFHGIVVKCPGYKVSTEQSSFLIRENTLDIQMVSISDSHSVVKPPNLEYPSMSLIQPMKSKEEVSQAGPVAGADIGDVVFRCRTQTQMDLELAVFIYDRWYEEALLKRVPWTIIILPASGEYREHTRFEGTGWYGFCVRELDPIPTREWKYLGSWNIFQTKNPKLTIVPADSSSNPYKPIFEFD